MIERDHYSVYDNDKLIPSKELLINHSITIKTNRANVSELITKPADQLQAMRDTSARKESEIHQKLAEATQEWEAQAAQTATYDLALEYVLTEPVQHTNNEWVVNEYGNQQISNMVYRMHCRVNEHTKYSQELKKSVPVDWTVTWWITTNHPDSINRYQYPDSIAGQSRKRFTDKAAMEKYVEGRKAAFASYFQEVSPPIPEGYAKRFMVSGQLLPGYTVENKEREEQAAPIPTEQTAKKKKRKINDMSR